MTNYLLLLFNQTRESVRHIGTRGGRAAPRNRRALLRAAAPPASPVDADVETAAAQDHLASRSEPA